MEKSQLQNEVLQIVRGRVEEVMGDYESRDTVQFGMLCFVEGVRAGLSDTMSRAFDTSKAGASENIERAIRAYLE
jgi:hypothetical protein